MFGDAPPLETELRRPVALDRGFENRYVLHVLIGSRLRGSGVVYMLGRKIVALLAASAYLISIPALAIGVFLLCTGGDDHTSFGQVSVAAPATSVGVVQVVSSDGGDETTTLVAGSRATYAAVPCQDIEVQHFQGPAPRELVDALSPAASPVPLGSGLVMLAAARKAGARPYVFQDVPDIGLKARRSVVLLI